MEEEKAYTRKQVEYMLRLEYNRGVKDGKKEERKTLLEFLETKKAN